jgi:hypothetical protein
MIIPSTRVSATQSVTVIKPFTSMHPCILICTGWPTWLLVLKALSLDCQYIFHTDVPLEWQVCFTQEYPLSSWFPMEHLTNPPKLAPNCIILLLGTSQAFQSLPSTWGTHYICIYSPHLQESMPDSAHPLPMFLVPHDACGGVTDGTWSLSCNRPLIWTLPQSVSQQVRHIVDSTLPYSLP